MKVTVIEAPSGYLPTIYWGQGEDMQRDVYAFAFENITDAEKAAKAWATECDAEYVPYKPIDTDAIRTQTLLVKRLRDDEGLNLRDAIAKAREMSAKEIVQGARAD